MRSFSRKEKPPFIFRVNQRRFAVIRDSRITVSVTAKKPKSEGCFFSRECMNMLKALMKKTAPGMRISIFWETIKDISSVTISVPIPNMALKEEMIPGTDFAEKTVMENMVTAKVYILAKMRGICRRNFPRKNSSMMMKKAM